jgi:hypothetical protein
MGGCRAELVVVSYSTPIRAISASRRVRPAKVDQSCRRHGDCDAWFPPSKPAHRRPNGTDDVQFAIVVPGICARISGARTTPPEQQQAGPARPTGLQLGKHLSAGSPVPDLGAILVRGPIFMSVWTRVVRFSRAQFRRFLSVDQRHPHVFLRAAPWAQGSARGWTDLRGLGDGLWRVDLWRRRDPSLGKAAHTRVWLA